MVRVSGLNASGWTDWLGEDVGKLKASCVDVMALRDELRVFLLEEKREASQLMVGECPRLQHSLQAGRSWWGGKCDRQQTGGAWQKNRNRASAKR